MSFFINQGKLLLYKQNHLPKSSGCVCGGRDFVVADDDALLETVVVDGLGLADVVVVVDDALLEGAYDDVFSLSGNGLKTNFIFS